MPTRRPEMPTRRPEMKESPTNTHRPTRGPRGAWIVIVATTVLLCGACSFSFSTGGDSRACKKFTDIATEIETADMSAPGLESDLEGIRSDAESDGQDAVAAAAGDLLSAVKDNDSSSLYAGLGEIEAACGEYRY